MGSERLVIMTQKELQSIAAMVAEMMNAQQDTKKPTTKSTASVKKQNTTEKKIYSGDHFTVFQRKGVFEAEKFAGKYGDDQQRHDRNMMLKGMMAMFGAVWCGDHDEGIYRWRFPDKDTAEDFIHHAKMYDEYVQQRREEKEA